MSTAPRIRPARFARNSSLEHWLGLSGGVAPMRGAAALLGMLAAAVAGAAEQDTLAAAARSLVGGREGGYVEAADGTTLLAQAADQAVHPASVSKVPTTLALLRKFGPEHRFTTTFAASGAIHGGTLDGDLLVESDGDPYLVDENAVLVAERLNQMGVQRVAGTLIVRGALTFDWQLDPDALRLRAAMSGMAPPAAWAAVREIEAETTNAPITASLTPPAIV